MVILCHSVEQVYILDISFINHLSIQSKLFAFSCFTIGRLGVPIFLFITGYLLLDRNYDNNQIKKFWINNLLQLLITTEIWIIIYNIFLELFHSTPIRLEILIKNILFLEQVNMGHMWYMSMIIGVYVFIPFVARALKNLDFSILLFPLSIVVVYLTIIPILNGILSIFKFRHVWPILFFDYSGGYYGLILLLGYIFKRYINSKIVCNYIVIIVGVLSYALVVLLQMFFYENGLAYPVWYNWFPLILSSICIILFFLIKPRMLLIKNMILISNLGKSAFGVYLIHFPLLMTLNKFMFFSCSMPLKVIYLFVADLVMSYFIVAILSRYTYIKKHLFYVKP